MLVSKNFIRLKLWYIKFIISQIINFSVCRVTDMGCASVCNLRRCVGVILGWGW